MSRELLILMVFLQSIAYGHKNDYKFKYRDHLHPQASTYSVKVIDSIPGHISSFDFKILDNRQMAVYNAEVKISNGNIDTLMIGDVDGAVTAVLPPGKYNIRISSLELNSIIVDSIILQPNSKIGFTAIMGSANWFGIALINSKRKLKKDEIEKIIDDLSNQREPELVKDKTCIVSWEI